MANGAHGQWGHGPWGLWPMVPWAIGTFLSIASLLLDGFLQNFTGHTYQCILSKYRAIFPRWLKLKHISMDFKFFLLSASCSESPSLVMQKFRVTSPSMRTAELGNFWVTKNRTEQEGASWQPFWRKFGNLNPYYSALC